MRGDFKIYYKGGEKREKKCGGGVAIAERLEN
jgi:hypothetical protein